MGNPEQSGDPRTYEGHKASVASTLTSNLDMVGVELMGSYARGSAVGGYSDTR